MEIIRGIENLKSKIACAVTVGTFDGMHPGHLKIIKKLIDVAVERNLCSTMATFHPHPKLIVGGGDKSPLKLLTTIDEKIKILEKSGLCRLVIINFNLPFSDLSYEQFIKSILIDKLGTQAIVVGYNHVFGKNREGNFSNLLKLGTKYNFTVDKVDRFEINGQVISSTFLRESLLKGNVEIAEKLLERKYSVSGEVVHGCARGKQLKYPTANLAVKKKNKLIPATGVYAVDVEYNDIIYKGMLNIGYRPTFNGEKKRSVEVHIFNFNKDIYQKNLTVYFKKRLRDEKKYDSSEALVAQLEIDKQKSLKL